MRVIVGIGVFQHNATAAPNEPRASAISLHKTMGAPASRVLDTTFAPPNHETSSTSIVFGGPPRDSPGRRDGLGIMKKPRWTPTYQGAVLVISENPAECPVR